MIFDPQKFQGSSRGFGCRACLLLGLFFYAIRAAVGAEALPPPEKVAYATPASRRVHEVSDRARDLLSKNNYDGLEALAGELRKSGEQADDGEWLLSTFYGNTVFVSSDEARGRNDVRYYEDWATQRPKSITAQMCYALALERSAWNAHGSPWADSEFDDRWRVRVERLDRAWGVLENARKLDDQCPEWYAIAQGIALGQSWRKPDYLALLDEAIRKQPTFGRYYSLAFEWMIPEWHGAPGEYEALIAGLADAQPEGERDQAYARYVWLADREDYREEMIFAPGRFDWARTRRGFENWLKASPDNFYVRSEFTRLAVLAGDRATARAQFQITGGKYAPGMWDGKVATFERAREFAFHGGGSPFVGSSRLDFLRNLNPEVASKVAMALGVIAGLFGGVFAGGLLFVLALQRGHPIPGVLALVGSLGLSLFFGTIATLVPAAILFWFLFLRRIRVPPLPASGVPSGWFTLLGFVAVLLLNVSIQFFASALGFARFFLKDPALAASGGLHAFFGSGDPLLTVINADWISLLAVLAISRWQHGDGWKERLGLRFCGLLPAIGAVLVGGLSIVVLDYLGKFVMDDRSRAAMELIALGARSPIIFFGALALVGPVAEELVFRGYLYSGWINRLGFLWTAVGTATVFALCHVQYGWGGMLLVLLQGLVFAVVRRLTGSIYPCMVLHIGNNLILAIAIYLKMAGAS